MYVTLLIRHYRNIQRVKHLVSLYGSHPGSKGRGRKDIVPADILRSAVVLLHATFEDMCRTIAARALPVAGKDALHGIPLIGASNVNRPERFSLGDLATHRGKTIQQVIKESVDAYLRTVSYNNVDGFCHFLASLRFRKSGFEKYFSNLDAMMKRRHHIVHQADRNPNAGKPGQQEVIALSKGTVKKWISTVDKVLFELNKECSRCKYNEV